MKTRSRHLKRLCREKRLGSPHVESKNQPHRLTALFFFSIGAAKVFSAGGGCGGDHLGDAYICTLGLLGCQPWARVDLGVVFVASLVHRRLLIGIASR